MSRSTWASYLHPHGSAGVSTGFRLVFAAVSGVALSFSYTGLYLGIYSWICLAILLVTLVGARPAVAFACGFVHAWFFALTSVPWIATVLAVHGGLSRAGGWAVLLLIAAVWGLLTGAFAWTVRRLAQRSLALAWVGAPFLWVSFEFVRAHLPEISFPWNLLGYPASNNLALLQFTTLTGIFGLSFIVAAFNALLAWVGLGGTTNLLRRAGALAAVVAVILLTALMGPHFVPVPQTSHHARAVQPNFPEANEYPPDWFQKHTADLDELDRLSLAPSSRQPDLLIWPEAPAPFSFEDPPFARRASSLAIRFAHPFISGVIDWKPLLVSSGGSTHNAMVPYNSAILIDPHGQDVFTYDKVHLVPFGEYEPFPLIHRVVASVSSEVGGFEKGTKYAVGPLPGGFRFAVFICYEAIYPGEVRRFAANGAELYINISNDGWFGRSAAPEQHLRMARVRAVENRRWLLRVTNNGYTASVDPYGRIARALPADARAAADLAYDFRTDQTIYTRFGDWFPWLCVAVSVILLVSTSMKGAVGEALLVHSPAPPALATSPR